MVLVDVREPDEFHSFSLPGALNVPLRHVLEHKYEPVFNSRDTKVVLYSFSTTQAEEAWLVLRRAGHDNIFVMDGGLNGLFHNIFMEEGVVRSPDCLLLHQTRFREKAKDFFQSGAAMPAESKSPTPVIKIIEVDMPYRWRLLTNLNLKS
jgi:rhodanese-related sulfurtransferase